MRDYRRIFLQIVRRQPVVLVANQCLKIAPGAARDYARSANVFGSQLANIFHPPATNIEGN